MAVVAIPLRKLLCSLLSPLAKRKQLILADVCLLACLFPSQCALPVLLRKDKKITLFHQPFIQHCITSDLSRRTCPSLPAVVDVSSTANPQALGTDTCLIWLYGHCDFRLWAKLWMSSQHGCAKSYGHHWETPTISITHQEDNSGLWCDR